MFSRWIESERWQWYAAGDETLANPTAAHPTDANVPERVVWEMGLAIAIPLVLAVVAGVVLG